jgi:hypothetical protein
MEPIEQAKALGLDTSKYIFQDGKYWCSAGDAQLVIEAVNSGKDVKPHYVKNAHANQGVERILILPPRGYAYNLEQLLKVTVKGRGLLSETIKPETREKIRQSQRTRRQREKQHPIQK